MHADFLETCKAITAEDASIRMCGEIFSFVKIR